MQIKPYNPTLNLQLCELLLQSMFTPKKCEDGNMRCKAKASHIWKQIEQVRHPQDIISAVKDPLTQIHFISDTHFFHTNIIQYSDRPFNDVFHMNESIINNHNNKVQPDDISIWVGDVSFGGEQKTKEIVHRLNGYKILIVGNHDIEKKKRIKPMAFDEVHICYNLTVNDTPLVFTHYPLDNIPDGWINCHGHIHKNGHRTDEIQLHKSHINVNCEFWNYTPISLKQIITMINNNQ
jgi:calcineurin-like phosphoesterase family protein